jgi:3'(2'), 5'-bisphosphate nucleotidase
MYHQGYGAVRNALAVMQHSHACYFKFPKPQQGGGSIWDFAATRLFFEELGLGVTNAKGEKLHLNDPDTTFMNKLGVIYASQQALLKEIVDV